MKRPAYVKEYHLMYLRDMVADRPTISVEVLVGYLSWLRGMDEDRARETYEYWKSTLEIQGDE